MTTHVQYDEPHRGLDMEGNEVTCTIQISLSKADAICKQRYALERERGRNVALQASCENLLEDFIVIHFASKVSLG